MHTAGEFYPNREAELVRVQLPKRRRSQLQCYIDPQKPTKDEELYQKSAKNFTKNPTSSQQN